MKKIFFGLFFVVIFSTPLVFAQNESEIIDTLPSRLIVPTDIYVTSKVSVPVNFQVKVNDGVDQKVSIQCDKISGGVFKVGKTTIRCEAEDSAGNKIRTSFVVTVGYEIVQIPLWVKQPTKFWIEDSTDDKTYAETIGFLIHEGVVKVPISKISSYYEVEIPIWIKTNAKYWVEGNISDDEYSIMLQWLINRGIIKI